MRNNQGFSLVEVIIVVGVMAIIASMSAPPLFVFMQKRDEQAEENALNQIYKALELYAKSENTLPSDVASSNPGNQSWAELLSQYTNLSAYQMENDVWGRPRAYIHYSRTERFLDTDIQIHYTTVLSRGANQSADSATGIAVGAVVSGELGRPFEDPGNTTWWKAQSNPTQSYAQLKTAGDDKMIKFTDYKQKIESYEKTLERLKAISGALETYSKGQYTNAIVATPSDPNLNNYIYYPRSRAGGNALGIISASDSSSNYHPQIATDMNRYSFSSDGDSSIANTGLASSSTSSQHQNRYNEMIQLMRLLGLPDSYCCSALQRFTDSSGESRERPFYYFSNPRARTSSGCASSRPGLTDLKLPARIVTTLTNNTCG